MALNKKVGAFFCRNCQDYKQVEPAKNSLNLSPICCRECKSHKVNYHNFTDEEIPCSNCDGSGIVEMGPQCDKPSSMCCGGCVQDTTCEICNGQKIIENPHFIETKTTENNGKFTDLQNSCT